MIHRRLALLAFTAVLSCSIGSAAADRLAGEPYVEVTLVSESLTAPRAGVVWLGLRQKITPGWHTYWRYAGDSGLPTQIHWTLPDGVSAGPIHWPRPSLHRVGPLANFGYSDEVMLLVPITISRDADVDRALEVTADVEWLVCADICVPERVKLALTLPMDEVARHDPGTKPLFVRYRALLPEPAPGPARVTRNGDRLVLHMSLPAEIAAGVSDAVFFPGDDGMIDNPAPQNVNITAEGLTIAMTAGARIGNDLEAVEGLVVIRQKRHGRKSARDLRVGPLPVENVSH